MTIEILLTILAIAAPIAVLLFGPRDAIARRLARREPPRTWHLETIIVGFTAAVITILAADPWYGWLAWAGTVFGHGSRSVGRRLYEAQALAPRSQQTVECFAAGRRYSYAATACFAGLNIALGLWGALTGLALGVAYDQWRELYTRRRARREQRHAEMARLAELNVREAGQAAGGPLTAAEAVERDALRHRLLIGVDLGYTPEELSAAALAKLGAGRVPAAEFAAQLRAGLTSERDWCGTCRRATPHSPLGRCLSHDGESTSPGLTPELRAAVAHLRELADQEERAAASALMSADRERSMSPSEADGEAHDHAAAVLRAAAADLERGAGAAGGRA